MPKKEPWPRHLCQAFVFDGTKQVWCTYHRGHKADGSDAFAHHTGTGRGGRTVAWADPGEGPAMVIRRKSGEKL